MKPAIIQATALTLLIVGVPLVVLGDGSVSLKILLILFLFFAAFVGWILSSMVELMTS